MLARALSLVVAGALALGAVPAHASAAPDANEIERLYNEGSDRNAAKNYSGAAESWTELLILLPENSANQSTRESVLLNVLDAYMNAYNGMRKADGGKDITHLRNGKRVLEQYLGAFQSAYGKKGVSSAVQERANTLDTMLEKAEEENRASPTPVPDDGPKTGPTTTGPVDDQPPPPPIQLPPERNGIGLIAGGATMIGVGLGLSALIIVGGIRGPRYEKDFETADSRYKGICGNDNLATCGMNPSVDAGELAMAEQFDADRDEAEDKGKQANTLTIVGAVLTPLFIAGGATMLAIGIKRNREAKAASRPTARFSPSVSRRFAGFVIQGRF